MLHFFVLQIRGYCVDLRKHIELKLWSVGLPFGEMFLALVMPFFNEVIRKTLIEPNKIAHEVPQKMHDFQDSKNFDSEIKGLLRFLFLISMSSILRSSLLASRVFSCNLAGSSRYLPRWCKFHLAN